MCGVFALYAAYLYLGSLLGYDVFFIARRDIGWQTMSPTLAFSLGFGVLAFVFLVLCLVPNFLLRRRHAQKEQHIVDALQHVVTEDGPH